MTQPTELKPGDRVCWVHSSHTSKTMSMRRREGTLVCHKENGVSEVRISKGKVIEVSTEKLQPISANPLRTFTEMLRESVRSS